MLALALGLSGGALPFASAAPASHGGLPRLAPTTLPPPEASAVSEVDAALAMLANGKDDGVKAGLARLEDGGAALVPAMAKKLAELRKSANRDLMGVFVGEARKTKSKGDDDDDKPKKKKKTDDD